MDALYKRQPWSCDTKRGTHWHMDGPPGTISCPFTTGGFIAAAFMAGAASLNPYVRVCRGDPTKRATTKPTDFFQPQILLRKDACKKSRPNSCGREWNETGGSKGLGRLVVAKVTMAQPLKGDPISEDTAGGTEYEMIGTAPPFDPTLHPPPQFSTVGRG